jgi:hypothetical protein
MAKQPSDSQRFPHAFAAAMNAGARGLIVEGMLNPPPGSGSG